jgi:hypothetical protein
MVLIADPRPDGLGAIRCQSPLEVERALKLILGWPENQKPPSRITDFGGMVKERRPSSRK